MFKVRVLFKAETSVGAGGGVRRVLRINLRTSENFQYYENFCICIFFLRIRK
jgi:hypothetical protein